MDKKQQSKKILFVLWSTAILFFTFLLVLSYNVRLCSDDLFQLAQYQQLGFLDSVVQFHSNIRWSSFLLFNAIFFLNDQFPSVHLNVFFYYLILLLSLFFGLTYLIRIYLRRFISFTLSKTDSLLLAVFFGMNLFFSTSEISEIWFWTGASTVYLVPVVAAIFGFGLLLSDQTKKTTYLGIFSCFLFIGGAVETFALSTVAVLTMLLVMASQKKDSFQLRDTREKIGMALFSVLILLIFNLASQRIIARYHFEIKTSLPQEKNALSTLLQAFLQKKNSVVVFTLCTMGVLGMILRTKGLQLPSKITKKRLLSVLLFATLIGAITFLPLLLTFHGLGPKRAWFPFDFFLTVLLSLSAFTLGNNYLHRIKKRHILTPLVVLSQFLLIFFYLVNQYRLTRHFAYQYDKRIEKIMAWKERGPTDPLYLSPIPDAGMVSNLELGDKNGKQNQGLKKLLQLKFDLILQEDKEKN
jgi:hypothetical protein